VVFAQESRNENCKETCTLGEAARPYHLTTEEKGEKKIIGGERGADATEKDGGEEVFRIKTGHSPDQSG